MFLFVFSVFVVFAAVAQVECNEDNNIFIQSNSYFSGRYYVASSRDVTENILISPLSLNYALTALSFGTDGVSLSQLRYALDQPGRDENENAILSSYKSFTGSFKKNYNVALATKLFVDNLFPVDMTYVNVLNNYFDAGVENINFARDPEGSRNIINKFVDDKTNHLIPSLLEEGDVTSATVSVLVNSVYFVSQWLYPFPQNQTREVPFYGLDQKFVVNMMNQAGYFQYREDIALNAQILEIPYVDKEFSFLVVLPKNTYGMVDMQSELESILSYDGSPFMDIFNGTSTEYVNINLPKFNFEQTHDLGGVLKTMGVEDIFNESTANFKRLSDDKVVINDVIQKTIIKLDENGTEVASATVLTMFTSTGELPPSPIEFNADHPFIYVIRHNPSRIPLFIGRFSQPETN